MRTSCCAILASLHVCLFVCNVSRQKSALNQVILGRSLAIRCLEGDELLGIKNVGH